MTSKSAGPACRCLVNQFRQVWSPRPRNWPPHQGQVWGHIEHKWRSIQRVQLNRIPLLVIGLDHKALISKSLTINSETSRSLDAQSAEDLILTAKKENGF